MEASTSAQDAASPQATPVTLTPALIKSFNDYPWVKDRQFLVSLPFPPTQPTKQPVGLTSRNSKV